MKTLIATACALSILTVACGRQSDDDAAPPRQHDEDGDDEFFALESGTYYVERVWDLRDGCGREPMHAQDPITAVPFTLVNGGNGSITLDRCSYDNKQLGGDVLENRGTLSVRHSKRQDGSGEYIAEYEQECRLELEVTGPNTFEGHYAEYQRNRNDVMRLASVDVPTCETSYRLIMTKR